MLVIDERDNVAVQTEGPQAGHKIARRDIALGEAVIKYGYPIGVASAAIKEGEWVHSHNLKTGLGDILDYTYEPIAAPALTGSDTFMGYARADGRVGVRNEIWIIPTVGCMNDAARALAKRTGAYAFCHPYGCSQLGEDHQNTQRALAGLICHPNAGGVLVLGLGCENNRIELLKKVLGDTYDPERVRFLEGQSVSDELAEGERLIEELKERAAQDKRTEQPVSKLVVGLKCGGSDGFSGITANPLVGIFSDLFIQKGGSTILTEVPEMFGAETILMNRCKDRETFEKTVSMINAFKNYYKANGQPVYENPSPGNKDGGITTLEEKSLGCTQKSGNAAVVDVLAYGERVKCAGLNLLNAPGNDLIAATALAASGAQIVLFTTGRGTPFGCPVPTMKIATNSALANRKQNWIDFNAGVLLEGESMSAVAQRFYQTVKEIANGERQTRNEENGYREISLFKTGVIL
ncbi:MAG: altronate dehydratase [Clostridiales bacterium]|nr:altronate dehydratase [Clostridiales bacterium]